MPKAGFALSILVLLSSVRLEASGQVQTRETKTETATVSGRVTLKGEPARGVTVILQGQNPGESNSPRARTDESGRFYFTGLPAGKYSISALTPGYVSPDEPSFPGLRGRTLNLTEGDRVENIDLEINRGGVIAGRITDSQGRPVVEEKVKLFKLNPSNLSGENFYRGVNYEMYQTDDRGHYRIYGLPEGRYTVSVGHAESFGSANIISTRDFYPRVFYPKATSFSEAKMIEVSEGSEAANIDITVPDPKQTYDIYGRVVDAGSGRPVAGVEVMLGWAPSEGRYAASGYAGSGARSGPNGEFHIFGVQPGRYAIHAQPDEQGGGLISDPVIVDIEEDTVTGVEIRLRRGATISGAVVIEGTNDPKVHAKLSQISLSATIRQTSYGPAAPGMVSGRVNAGGGFRLSGLQPGKVAIQMSNTRDFVLLRIERNGEPVGGGIEVEAGEQVTGVRVVLAYSPLAIHGELRVIGGALPADYRFIALIRKVDQSGPNMGMAEIDARGRFIIENLSPGEYEVRIISRFQPERRLLSPDIGRLISSIKERVVLGGSNQHQVTLVVDLSQKIGDK
jgi:protocatechuate 3,4-dioxygenase beta subunit